MDYQEKVDMLEEIMYDILNVKSYIKEPMDKAILDKAISMIENVKWGQEDLAEEQEDTQ